MSAFPSSVSADLKSSSSERNTALGANNSINMLGGGAGATDQTIGLIKQLVQDSGNVYNGGRAVTLARLAPTRRVNQEPEIISGREESHAAIAIIIGIVAIATILLLRS